MAADFLPFIFVAKNDIDKAVSEEFALTWNDNTGGSGAIKLYLKEIVRLAMANISSARWSAKQTSAFALADAATSIGSSIPIPGGHA
jgi:proteasome component ECM29